jgi:hypothetical protein
MYSASFDENKKEFDNIKTHGATMKIMNEIAYYENHNRTCL